MTRIQSETGVPREQPGLTVSEEGMRSIMEFMEILRNPWSYTVVNLNPNTLDQLTLDFRLTLGFSIDYVLCITIKS